MKMIEIYVFVKWELKKEKYKSSLTVVLDGYFEL